MADEYIHRLKVEGPEISQTLDLPIGAFTIGRQEGNNLRLNSPLISRSHAQFECTPAACQITDLGSANGTIVNGARLEANSPVRLKSGDVVEIGPFKLAYEQIAIVVAEPEPPPAKPKPKPAPPKKKPAEKKAEEAPKAEEKAPVEEPTPAGPPVPPQPPRFPDGQQPIDYGEPPPGLTKHSSRYINFLPSIYHTDFMERFLAIFEAVLTPTEWTIDNFDLFLNPRTTPPGFIDWLARWFSISFDPSWSEFQQRTLLDEAHDIFARRGTRWALSRVLEIYIGAEPEIIDLEEDQDPFTFTVKVPFTEAEVDRALIERIVDANKPAHTNYRLLFKTKKK